jgi:hypothetical protein
MQKIVMRDQNENIVAELDLDPSMLYRFKVETLWGDKEYELKPTYHFVSATHSKDFTKPSGMVLTKA